MYGTRFSPLDPLPEHDAVACCLCPDSHLDSHLDAGMNVDYCPRHGETPDFSACHDPVAGRAWRLEHGIPWKGSEVSDLTSKDYRGRTIRPGDPVRAWDGGVELAATVKAIVPNGGVARRRDLLVIVLADTGVEERRDSDQVEVKRDGDN